VFWLICINYDAAIESIDIPRILSQQGGETVYPLPRIKSLEFHPKSNLAALVFAVTCYLTLFIPCLSVNVEDKLVFILTECDNSRQFKK